MDESSRSDGAAAAPEEPPARRGLASAQDLCVGLGVAATALGAGLFHVGAGLIVFGLALVVIGVRAGPTGG